MRAFWNLIKHKYLRIPAVVGLLLILPLFIFVVLEKQDTRSKAEKATTLSFSPTSSKSKPISHKIGDDFYVDLMINPGKNLISLLKLDIQYDPSKIELLDENPININTIVFPKILEGPLYSNGRIQIVLSVGPDTTRAIATESRVLTLNFKANKSTNKTLIKFGTENSAFSVSVNDQSGENVISTMTPAYVKINKINKGKKPKR